MLSQTGGEPPGVDHGSRDQGGIGKCVFKPYLVAQMSATTP
jgi:hypothetical protein